MTRYFTIAEINQQHKILCPQVSLEYFMDVYCKMILSSDPNIKAVEVKVSEQFKFEFKK